VDRRLGAPQGRSGQFGEENSFRDQLPASHAYYAGIKIFNSLPSNITALIDKQAQFKVALKRYLITHSFYSVEEFML
jgi:hypothetical protein